MSSVALLLFNGSCAAVGNAFVLLCFPRANDPKYESNSNSPRISLTIGVISSSSSRKEVKRGECLRANNKLNIYYPAPLGYFLKATSRQKEVSAIFCQKAFITLGSPVVPLLSTSKADSGLASEFRRDRAVYTAYERMLRERGEERG